MTFTFNQPESIPMYTTLKRSEAPVADLYPGDLPAELQAYLGEASPAIDGAAPAAACCSTTRQATCCEPADKDACCGTEATTAGPCGCQ